MEDLLAYEGDDVEDVFMQTFTVSYKDVFGTMLTRELKPGGDMIALTSQNKKVRHYLFTYPYHHSDLFISLPTQAITLTIISLPTHTITLTIISLPTHTITLTIITLPTHTVTLTIISLPTHTVTLIY